MTKWLFWVTTALGATCLVVVAVNIAMVRSNQALQAQINGRQQFIQQSVQLEGLYREIVRALAELGARNNDDDVRALLARHGITYTVNSASTPATPSTSAGSTKR